VKFYLDANLSRRIAERLRQKGWDATSAHEVGNPELSDAEQLAYATAEGRGLVTKDIEDFTKLSRNAVASQKPHAGIILCPRSLLGSEIVTIAERLITIAERFPEGLGGYDVLYV
jgi:predicted nuclease of predicted toxin-antitoxin system